MSPDQTTAHPTSHWIRILWLVVAHVVVGVAGALATRVTKGQPDTLQALFAGLVFSQVSLLGIWAGSASNSWYVRLAGAAVGDGYLFVLVCFSSGSSSRGMIRVLVIFTVITLIVAAVLLVARCFRVRIRLETSPGTAARGLQFSIRDLMILTFVVACSVAFGKWLLPRMSWPRNGRWWLSRYLPYIVIGLLSVWPALSAKRPLLPCSILVAIAVGIGMCFGGFGFPMNTTYFITMTSVEALSLVVSLLVVRSCGYRMVRLPA